MLRRKTSCAAPKDGQSQSPGRVAAQGAPTTSPQPAVFTCDGCRAGWPAIRRCGTAPCPVCAARSRLNRLTTVWKPWASITVHFLSAKVVASKTRVRRAEPPSAALSSISILDRIALLGDARDPCVAREVDVVGEQELEWGLADEILVLRSSLRSMTATLRPSATIWNRSGKFEPHAARAQEAEVPLGAPPSGPIWTKSAVMTRATSSQALARATASQRGLALRAFRRFGGLFGRPRQASSESSGACWAKPAPAATRAGKPSASHR